MLRRLSVFVDGWTLDAAEVVATTVPAGAALPDPACPPLASEYAQLNRAEIPALLDQLVSKSLVGVDQERREPRYRMLEMVRQYAHEKLVQAGENEPAHRSHLAYVCELTDRVNPEGTKPEDYPEYDEIQDEIGNVRAAFEWALQSGDQPAGVRMIHNLRDFWYAIGRVLEGLRWARAILPQEHKIANPQEGADTHFILGMLYHDLQDGEQALRHYTIALPLAYQAENSQLIKLILYGLSWVTPDMLKALEYAHALLTVAPEQERAMIAADLEMNLGHRARLAGDLAEASRHYRIAMDSIRVQGNPFYIGTMSRLLGQLAMAQGDNAAARPLVQQSLTVFRQLRNPGGEAEALVELATLAERQGDTAAALQLAQECTVTFLKLGNLKPICQAIAVAAGVALLQDEIRHAATLLSAADELWQSIPQSFHYKADYRFEYERLLPRVRAALSAAEFDEAWAAGQGLTLDQVTADVMSMRPDDLVEAT